MGSTVETKAKIIFDVDNRARQALQKAGNQMEALQRRTKNLSSTFRTMRNVGAVAFGAIATGIGFAVAEASKIQDLEVSFTTMLGSVDKAKESIKGLRDFAAATPFQFDGIAQSARQLLAFGVTADDMQDKLKFLGDIASGAGVPLQDMAAIFGKAKAKGKAMTEELLQMSDRGVPVIKVLGDRLGKTGEEIFKMASEGEISFEILEGALQSMSEEGGIFFDLMEKRSQTLSGRLSTLKDNIINASVPLGNAFLPILQEIAEKLIPIVERVGKWIEENPELTKTILLAVGAFAGMVAVFGTLGLILPSVIGGITAVGTALAFVAANPIILIVAGIALIANNLKDIVGVLLGVEITWKDVWDSIIDFTSDMILGLMNLFEPLLKLFNKVKDSIVSIGSSIKSGAVDLAGKAIDLVSVDDAIITPGGKVIQPADDDFIIATKDPSALGGGQSFSFDFRGANISNKEQFINDIKTQLGRGLQLKELGI